LHWVPLPTIKRTTDAALRSYTIQTQSPFWLLKPASEHAPAT
jgi:hypothetical protein